MPHGRSMAVADMVRLGAAFNHPLQIVAVFDRITTLVFVARPQLALHAATQAFERRGRDNCFR